MVQTIYSKKRGWTGGREYGDKGCRIGVEGAESGVEGAGSGGRGGGGLEIDFL